MVSKNNQNCVEATIKRVLFSGEKVISHVKQIHNICYFVVLDLSIFGSVVFGLAFGVKIFRFYLLALNLFLY